MITLPFENPTPTRTIWVSANGSASGDGSESSPYRTIQDAIDAATPGTAIMVKAGTYHESISLSGVHGRPDAPIQLISADGQGAAKIVGGAKATVGAWGISNVGIYDFHIVASNPSGDEGGFKLAGSWNNPAQNLVIAGNIITGSGQDGFKLYNGATNVVVVGNTIDGDWRQEAIDNVSVENVTYAYNTIKGTAGYTGITMKAGSRDIEVVGNEFSLEAPTGIMVGGHGTSRLNREFPAYWEGFEARNINVVGNTVEEAIAGRSLVFVGANNSVARGNYFADDVGSKSFSISGHFTHHSYNNQLIDNSVAGSGFFKPNSGQSSGYVVSGNIVGGQRPAGGTGAAEAQAVYDWYRAAPPPPPVEMPSPAQPAPIEEPAQPDPVEVPGKGAWVASGAPTNTVTGTAGRDNIVGTDANDRMDGGREADIMAGGKGDDTYILSGAGDVIVEREGEGVDTVIVWAPSYALPENVENMVLKTAAGVDALGNDLANIIEGGAGADRIDGRGGDDLISGGAGADVFVIGAGQGNDVIRDLAAEDRIELDGFVLGSFAALKKAARADGADTVIDLGGGQVLRLQGVSPDALASAQFTFTNVQPPPVVEAPPAVEEPPPVEVPGKGVWIASGAPTNTVTGTAGRDNIVGTDANDRMDGGREADIMAGGKGDDTYILSGAGDVVVEREGEGVDTVIVWAPSYALPENVENMVLKTAAGVDALGNDLANIIEGGAGADRIDGRGGDDLISGGAGADVFVIGAGQGNDVIRDLAAEDRIELDGFVLGSFAALKKAARAEGADTVIDLGGGQVLRLQGIAPDALASAQFTFTNVQPPPRMTPEFTFPDLSHWGIGAAPTTERTGTGGEDYLRGTSGNDRINGGAKADVMEGLGGDDTYIVSGTADRIVETENGGIDTAIVWANVFDLPDHVENLEIRTTGGSAVSGNALDNLILGGGGADTIRGGLGADLISGGAGRDVFVYGSLAEGGDVIRDFAVGEDSLDLAGLADRGLPMTGWLSDSGRGAVLTVQYQGEEARNLVLFENRSAAEMTQALDGLFHDMFGTAA